LTFDEKTSTPPSSGNQTLNSADSANAAASPSTTLNTTSTILELTPSTTEKIAPAGNTETAVSADNQINAPPVAAAPQTENIVDQKFDKKPDNQIAIVKKSSEGNNIVPTAEKNQIEKIEAKNNAPKNNLSTNAELQAKEAAPESKTEQIIDALPLDTPTRRAAKKIMYVSGGSALAAGLYLGLRLLKNLV
jgi:hypothetical protein